MAICFPLSNVKACTLVDSDIARRMREIGKNWHVHKGYVAITRGSGKNAHRSYLHRMVAATKRGLLIDHRNGNRLDNRRSNLRLATSSQNGANIGKPTTNTTGFKGVVPHGKRFRAYIHKYGKTRYLGTFDTPKAAACEYDRQAKRLFGPFAAVNGTRCR